MENEFIIDNINIAYKIANDFYKKCNIIEYEDLKQICLLGLTKAARTYDADKSKFSTYAYSTIKNEISMELRKLNKVKNTYSIDEIMPNTENITIKDTLIDDCNIEDDFISKEESELLHKYVGELKEKERKIVDLYLKGYNQKEIGENLNMSQANISRILKKIIGKLRYKYVHYDK